MADNNNNRKSKRNFRLEKPVERRFDIEKEVDAAPVASTKTATEKPTTQNQPTGKPAQGGFNTSKEPVIKIGGNVPPTGPNGGSDDNNEGGNSSKKWIIIALIIVALAACAYFFMGGNKSDEATVPETPQVEQNDSTQNDENANDSTANAANESEENATEDNGNATDDATAANQDADNKSEGASAPQVSESKQSTPAAKPVSNTTSNSSGVSSQPASSTSSSSIEQKAKDVWKGVYGNNPERRKNLGSDYEEVQKLVNKMHRQGLN